MRIESRGKYYSTTKRPIIHVQLSSMHTETALNLPVTRRRTDVSWRSTQFLRGAHLAADHTELRSDRHAGVVNKPAHAKAEAEHQTP